MILESILTTGNLDGSTHIAPLGLHVADQDLIVAPFRPSRTLDNLLRTRVAVVNWSTDVRLFAGPVTGRHDFALLPARVVAGQRLAASQTHAEVAVIDLVEDSERPRLRCRIVHEEQHAPFRGLVRAQAAVVEAAILATRLHLLPRDKIERELTYLQIAIDKTAGPAEREAWDWLCDHFARWRGGVADDRSGP